MGTIFLDIETTGLDYVKDEIITIQLRDGNYPIEIFKSWESDEKTILENFVNRLVEIQKSEFTWCVGFSTLTFDIPFLMSRCSHYNIETPKKLIEIFYRNLAHCDLKQILLPNNQWKFKGLNWDYCLKIFGHPTKVGFGNQIPIWFKEREYEKIISYIESEFQPMSSLYWELRNKMKVILE